MSLQSFITSANQAKTARELVAIWEQAMAFAGFDRLLFSLLTDHYSIDRKAGHIVAVNFPQDWLAGYFARGFEPMRQHMLVAKGAFAWNDLTAVKRLNTGHARIFLEGPATALHNGIGIPLRGPFGAFGGVTAASSIAGASVTKDVLAHVHLLSHHFYTLFQELEQKPGKDGEVRLTEQEREVLTWYSLGKSQPEIAIILDVTPHVVKFHLKGIFKKLNVHNDRVAVLKATAMGLITPKSSQLKISD